MNKRIGLVTAGLVAGLVMVGGTALAASSSIPDSNQQFHGCYETGDAGQTDGTQLQIVDNSKAGCSHGMSAITWAEQGPAGAQGNQGIQGVQGVPGPSTAGTAGLDAIIVSDSGTGSAKAPCPSDHPYLLGGGGSAEDSEGNPGAISASQPNFGSPSGTDEGTIVPISAGLFWAVEGPAGDFVVAYAICAK